MEEAHRMPGRRLWARCWSSTTARWNACWRPPVLRKLGFSVTCAASAEQALARMASHRFALAICDISLPGMDGLALLAALSAAAAGAALHRAERA